MLSLLCVQHQQNQKQTIDSSIDSGASRRCWLGRLEIQDWPPYTKINWLEKYPWHFEKWQVQVYSLSVAIHIQDHLDLWHYHSLLIQWSGFLYSQTMPAERRTFCWIVMEQSHERCRPRRGRLFLTTCSYAAESDVIIIEIKTMPGVCVGSSWNERGKKTRILVNILTEDSNSSTNKKKTKRIPLTSLSLPRLKITERGLSISLRATCNHRGLKRYIFAAPLTVGPFCWFTPVKSRFVNFRACVLTRERARALGASIYGHHPIGQWTVHHLKTWNKRSNKSHASIYLLGNLLVYLVTCYSLISCFFFSPISFRPAWFQMIFEPILVEGTTTKNTSGPWRKSPSWKKALR